MLALGLTSATGIAGAFAEPPAASVSKHSTTTSSDSSPTAALPALQVLTIGDSIMNGHGLPSGDAWPYLVASVEGWDVTNDGCDGAGVLTPGDPAKCDSDYAGIISASAAMSPNIVIIEGSSNDFDLDNSALLVATISEVQSIKFEFPSAQIVGLSTLWGSTVPQAELAQVNAQVKVAVTDAGGTYLDIGQPMEGHPELMQADDVHPTAAGQAVLATTIEHALGPVERAAIEAEQADAARVARVHELVALGDLE